MNKSTSKTGSRIWIILTLLSLAGLAFIFEYTKTAGWTTAFTLIEIIFIVLLFFSFVMGYVRTGLWAFGHRSLKQLDERELMVISHSLRIAYAIFTVLVLSFLMFVALTERSISMVSVVSFLIFAHLLPASIVGWSKSV